MKPAVEPGLAAALFAVIPWCGRTVRIEHAWVGEDLPATAPVLVFLHEGLGSVAMWKQFPAQLCAALGARGLVFSRPGYGRSTPRPADETWAPDFLHRQAFEVLPALFQALNFKPAAQPTVLFGHSDGGSIALLHAARHSADFAATVVLAPHLFVEDISVQNIEAARQAYEQGDLQRGLAKYHDDPDSAFWGWNGVWLSPAFRSWNIEAEVAGIQHPLLAVQGLDDAYGTLAQIRQIVPRVPQAQLLELPACGHSPHRDQPAALVAAVQDLLRGRPGFSIPSA
jgi:pimeloyl-ACP methyl ester carboxylesterase